MKKIFFYLLLLPCNVIFAQHASKKINGCGLLTIQPNIGLYQNYNPISIDKFDCFLQTITDSTNYDFTRIICCVELKLSKMTINQLFFDLQGKTVVLDYNGEINNVFVGDKLVLKIQFIKSIRTFYYFKLLNILSKK
jgi:hypothetical protein